MKKILIITTLLILGAHPIYAQRQTTADYAAKIDVVKVCKNVDTIKAKFKQKLETCGFTEKDKKYGKLRSRLSGMSLLFEINDYQALDLSLADFDKYEKIRRQFLDSLSKVYPQKPKSENDNSQNAQKTSNVKPQKSEDERGIAGYISDNWFLIMVAFLELGIIAFLVKKWNRAENKNENLEGKTKDLKQKIQKLKAEQQNLDEQIRELKKTKNTEPILCKTNEELVSITTPTAEPKTETSYKYLCQINEANGGYFKRIQDSYDGSSSYYRMFNIKDGQAEYEFYGDEVRAISKWNSILDAAAEYNGDYHTARHIQNLAPGLVQYDNATERWKVTKKAKLKLY
ncbi:MAG: hypothetical protein K6F33_13480 [Bacteroidales bacterium]|nr:hypothetical protein [Bacteroidales bacterium]